MYKVKSQPVVRYFSWTNTIKLPQKVGCSVVPDFAAAINEWIKRRPYDLLTIDFKGVMQAYSNGMLPIIATMASLRFLNHKIKVILPDDSNVRKIFRLSNWAYFLDNQVYEKSESTHDKHLVTKQFHNYQDLAWIMKDFMDVILRSVPKIPKDIFSALEWSVNEICDNVINHSESKVGGFVQMVTFSKQEQVSFTVADAGRGILNSLKEGIPTLRTDLQAIGEAMKAGVTRNKEFGQGNGLAGSLKITTLTNGSLDILSGTGRFFTTQQENHKQESQKNQNFFGTSVSGIIRMNKNFSITKALDFNGLLPNEPLDMIDLVYEMPDKDCFLITMENETTGFGTRNAGKQLRVKTLNLINAKPGHPVYINWSGIPVISSSFADEFMGKLFLELGAIRFSSIIRNNKMEVLVRQLLDKAIMQRLGQTKD